MARSVEQGSVSKRQIYEAACAALPTKQQTRKEHLLLADIKQALSGLPNVDTSDVAIEILLDELVVAGNVSYDKGNDTYKIVERTPVDDIEDTAEDLFAEMGGDESVVADEDTPHTDGEGTASSDENVDDAIHDMFAEMGDDSSPVDTTTATTTTNTATPSTTATATSQTTSPDAAASPDTAKKKTPEKKKTSPDTAPAVPKNTPPAPAPHHTAAYSERRFARWANRVQDVHKDLLRIVSNLDTGKLDELKKSFKELTGEAWNESFSIHQFLADKKSGRTENRETESEKKSEQYSSAVSAYQEKLIQLFTELGLPQAKTADKELSELTGFMRANGLAPAEAVTEFVEDLRDEYIAKHNGDVVKAERELYFILANMTDTTLEFHMQREYEQDPQESVALAQAREAFLQAQEDFNDFEKKILRNPFTSGKKRKALVEALEHAREAYNVESAKMIAGKSHRFLNEYNTQIDQEIEIRDERRAARGGDGMLHTLKDKFYGMYKWLGDQSLDKAYQAQKGEEPTKGKWIRKAANLRSAIGFGLGLVGLRSGWRAAMGAGAGIGTYEGFKAKTTANIQSEAHRLLEESNPANIAESEIYDVMQQIRMRAALDGKTVVDTKFPLHDSFAKLRELLDTQQKAIPKETREQAFANADRIRAALDSINGQLETDMTEQAAGKRKQVLAGLAVGGATAVVAPWVLEKLGVGAEKIADWWVGDPAVSDSLESVVPDVPPVPPTPVEVFAGDGARAIVDRGEGAYHAVYKLMDQLSDTDKVAFAESIGEEHPDWIERDANGSITNIDRVLRNWRHEAVEATQLDSGDTAMVYDPSSREYGVSLRTGAEFSLEYDDDGYPRLHLHGSEDTGNYRILDEHVVRHVAPDGDVSFVPPNEVPAMEAAEAPIDTATTLPDAQSVLDSAEAVGTQLDALGSDAVATIGEVGRGTADVAPDSSGVPTAPVDATLEGRTREFTPDTFPTSETIRTLQGGNGVEVEITNHGNHLDVRPILRVDPTDVQSSLLTIGGEQLQGLNPYHYDVATSNLNDIYAVDRAIDQMASDGQQFTPEYQYLTRYVSGRMEQVAHILDRPVGDVFDNDIAESYGYTAGQTAEQLVEAPAESISEVLTAGDSAPVITTQVLQDIRTDFDALSPVDRSIAQTVLSEYESLNDTWDNMTPDEQAMGSTRVAAIERELRALLDRSRE